jgi:transcription elongation factor Elf1
MINFSEVFIYSDQPTTCPECGMRTEIILDLFHTKEQTQIHKCPSVGCNFEFEVQNDFKFAE